MKRMLALLVALMAITMSGALALTATPPDWLEEMQPGATYTYGEYGTLRAVTEDDTFTPQTLNSKLTFASGDVSADIDQTAATSIAGTPEGVTRQLMQQSASAFVAQWPTIAVDAENDDGTTTLIMNMQKDQSALFSGKIVSTGEAVLKQGTDTPFDGLGVNDLVDPNHYDYQASDDPYGGNHINSWYEIEGSPASFTTTFDDTGSLTTTDANGEQVTLKQKLAGAQVVVSADAASVADTDGGLVLLSAPCIGRGELWHIDPDGTLTMVADNGLDEYGQGTLITNELPVPTSSSSAQLTEAAASVTSGVTLTDKEIDILGSVYDVRTMDGNFGLDGAFANAVLTEGSTINVDLDGDMDFWWE